MADILWRNGGMRGVNKGLRWKGRGKEAFTIKALLSCKIVVKPVT